MKKALILQNRRLRIRKLRLVVCALLLCVLASACTGTSKHSSVTAVDPFTDAELTLHFSANYPGSEGRNEAFSGRTYESKLTYDEIVAKVKAQESVEDVFQVERFTPLAPEMIDHWSAACIFVPCEDGRYSAYYLDRTSFFGMDIPLKLSSQDQLIIQLPYHLMGDDRVAAPPYSTMLDGVEYMCNDGVYCDDFISFYQKTGYGTITRTDAGFNLKIPEGDLIFSFATHVDQTFVSMQYRP